MRPNQDPLVFKLISGRHLCSALFLQRGCGIIERTGLGNKENFAYTNWVVIKIKGTLLVFEARKITKKGETLGAVSNLISNIVKSILHHFGEI